MSRVPQPPEFPAPAPGMPPIVARMSLADFFVFEERSESKHDWYKGDVLDMSGGTMKHSRIGTNLIVAVSTRLPDGPCQVFNNDLRLGVSKKVLYSYPDLSIFCDEPQFDENDPNQTTASNPTVVFEVTSESTEKYDRSDKFERYVLLPSLQDYVLVSQKAARVDVYTRRDDGSWLVWFYKGTAAVARLESVGIGLPLSEIYRGVDLPPESV
jgi:Uma2 family endonuclease